MRILQLSLILVVMILAAGCGGEPRLDAAAIEPAVRAVLIKQQEAWNAGDIEDFMVGYARTDSTRFVGGRGPTYGWQTVLDNYRRGYPDRASMGRLEFTERPRAGPSR